MVTSLPACHLTSEKHLSQIIRIFSLQFCPFLSLKTSYPYFSSLPFWFPLPAPTTQLDRSMLENPGISPLALF